jgi:flagellin-like protein
MKGISEIIAVILILMITVSLTSLAYITFTSFFSTMTKTSEQTISQTLSNMMAQMKIEAITASNPRVISIRNVGKVDLTSFVAYVNDVLATFTPPAGNTIAPGAIGSLTITNPNPVAAGSTIKITCAQGAIAIQSAP